jgi:hypothetical protein
MLGQSHGKPVGGDVGRQLKEAGAAVAQPVGEDHHGQRAFDRHQILGQEDIGGVGTIAAGIDQGERHLANGVGAGLGEVGQGGQVKGAAGQIGFGL